MKKEWLPTNPCIGCKKDTYVKSFRFNFEGKCLCLSLAEYSQKLEAQRILLNSLLKEHDVNKHIIELMAKQVNEADKHSKE